MPGQEKPHPGPLPFRAPDYPQVEKKDYQLKNIDNQWNRLYLKMTSERSNVCRMDAPIGAHDLGEVEPA